MRDDSNARGFVAASAKDGGEESLSIPRAVTLEVQLARQFLASLPDLRTPWAMRLESWADERALSPKLRRAVKVTVLRLRTFHAIERSRRRRRP